jgi:hypothetical protein
VSDLIVSWPAPHLPPDVRLLDTPGVNTDDGRNTARAWAAIETQADACVVISNINQPFSLETVRLVERLRSVTPHLVLVLTQLDKAQADAEDLGRDGEAEIADAVADAVRKFARQVGRKPDDVLALGVGALPALKHPDGPWGRHFGQQIGRLLGVVAGERALAMAARATASLDAIREEVASACRTAESAYAKRLAQLYAQRIPEPAALKAEVLHSLRPAVDEVASAIAAGVLAEIDVSFAAAQAAIAEGIDGCASKDALKRFTSGLEGRLGSALSDVNARVSARQLELRSEGWGALAPRAYQPLAERYRLAKEAAVSHVVAAARLEGGISGSEVAANVAGVLSDDTVGNALIAAGGAVIAGAAGAVFLGAVFAPALLFGALIWGAMALFTSLDSLKNDCKAKVTEALDASRAQFEAQAAGLHGRTVDDFSASLSTLLDAEIARYAVWIHTLLAAEEANIGAERARLKDIEQITASMGACLQRLDAAKVQATAESRAICFRA